MQYDGSNPGVLGIMGAWVSAARVEPPSKPRVGSRGYGYRVCFKYQPKKGKWKTKATWPKIDIDVVYDL